MRENSLEADEEGGGMRALAMQRGRSGQRGNSHAIVMVACGEAADWTVTVWGRQRGTDGG